ncbi:MAG: DUF1850 domain-containing protein [Oscillospiraceae bacterium]
MMRRKKNSSEQWTGPKRSAPLLRFILIAVCFAVFAALLPIFTVLTISGSDKNYCLPLSDGEAFSIKYTHSVNRSPVIDTIERTGHTLTIRSSLYQTYGAGIPVLSDEVGDTYTETDEGFLLSGIDSEQNEINLITGTYSNHRLLYRGHELTLKKTFGEKTLITFKIGRVSLITFLFYRL